MGGRISGGIFGTHYSLVGEKRGGNVSGWISNLSENPN